MSRPYPNLAEYYTLSDLALATSLARQIEDTPGWHVTSLAEDRVEDLTYWLINTEYRDTLSDGRQGLLWRFREIRSLEDFARICQHIQEHDIVYAYAAW